LIARLFHALGLVLLLALAACGGRDEEERALRIVGPWEFAGLDPAQDAGLIFQHLQITENLVSIAADGRLIPALARDWTIAPDQLSWRFRLRPGVRFHDGTALTADAVAFNLRRAHAGASVLSRVPISAIDTDGDAVVIRLLRPFASLPAFLVNYSTVILAPASFDAQGRVRQVIGTGAFRILEATPPFHVDMARFDHWWGGRAGVARATYLSVGRGETRALMALSGQADLTISVLPVFVDRLRKSPDLSLDIVTIPRTRILKLNLADPKFADLRVRRAISLAIDRQSIASALFRTPALAATQLLPPSIDGWHAPGMPPLRHDPREARALLAAAGWTAGPDGIVQRDGQRFAIELLTYFNWPELPPLATALQAQLRDVGIDASVSVGNSSDIVARHRDGTLSAGLASRNYGFTPDPLAALLQDFGPDGGDWGATGWHDAELLRLQQEMSGIADPARRRPLQERAAAIIHRDLPVIPIIWSDVAVVSNRRIVGAQADPFEINFHIADIRWRR